MSSWSAIVSAGTPELCRLIIVSRWLSAMQRGGREPNITIFCYKTSSEIINKQHQ
jgi:hypothetical protein